jgi:hypothetical protein
MFKYCVSCGFQLENGDYKCVCIACSGMTTMTVKELETYTPKVCGDSECYLDSDGMPNLDGECDHAHLFYELFPIM